MRLISLLSAIFLFINVSAQIQGTGLNFDDNKYDQVQMKAPLTRGLYTNIPKNYSLKQYAPYTKSQGNYGTCVGWSTAYAALTIVESRKNNLTDRTQITNNTYSPGFIYKQIKMATDVSCSIGSSISDALEIMKTVGAAKYDDMPEKNCPDYISEEIFEKASKNKITDYAKIFEYFDNSDFKINAVKKSLSQNNPVVIGMMVPNSFYTVKELWEPTENYLSNYPGHAMCVVGYDDAKYGGAFEIINSWGNTWGTEGFTWIKYKDFANFVKYAYEIIDMQISPNNNGNVLSGSIKFIKADRKESPVTFDGQKYKLNEPYSSGTHFRLYISNSEPAFVYAFGSDATGQIFPIFPYKANISAALTYAQNDVAIPDEDHYIETDNTIGTDYLCVIYTKEEINFDELISNIKLESGTFYEKVNNIIGNKLIEPQNVTFSNSKISFKTSNTDKKAVGLFIETQHIK
jgi:hypothetical protein